MALAESPSEQYPAPRPEAVACGKQKEAMGISRYQCEDLEVFGNIPIVPIVPTLVLNPFVHG